MAAGIKEIDKGEVATLSNGFNGELSMLGLTTFGGAQIFTDSERTALVLFPAFSVGIVNASSVRPQAEADGEYHGRMRVDLELCGEFVVLVTPDDRKLLILHRR